MQWPSTLPHPIAPGGDAGHLLKAGSSQRSVSAAAPCPLRRLSLQMLPEGRGEWDMPLACSHGGSTARALCRWCGTGRGHPLPASEAGGGVADRRRAETRTWGVPFSSGAQDQRVDMGALPAEPQVAPPSLFWFGGAPSDPGPVALIWSII